jgi:hypothetical protein
VNGVLDVLGYMWRGAGGDWNSPERGCCIADRWQGRIFFTDLMLIYTWILYYSNKQHSLCLGFGLAASGLDSKL